MWRIAVLLVCAVFLCCSDNDSTGPSDDGEIYPLAIGNTWTFEVAQFDTLGNVESLDTISGEVVRDTVIAGETWYVTEGEDEDGIHSGYCILRSDGFYEGWPQEELLYKYPVQVGDWYMVEDDTVQVEDLSESVSVPAGDFDCVRYRIHGYLPIVIYQRLCPNVGLVSVEANLERANGDLLLAMRIRLLSYTLY